MSTNGVSKDVFHLLYQSDDDEEEFELLNNQSQYTKRPLIKNNNDSKIFVQNNDKRKFKSRPEEHPVISHDPKFQDSITVASRNGVVQIPKGAVPPSMVRSRSSGKVAETSFFGSGSSELSVGSSAFGVKISKEVLAEAEEAGEENFVYKKMQTGDTIQGIALQYHTTIAEIKRLNGLISDQDLFGLKHIKVPTSKHSVLHETHSSVILPSPTPSLEGAMSVDHLGLSTRSSDTSGIGADVRSGRLKSESGSSDHLNNPAKWLESRTISINQAMTISADLLQSDLSEMCSHAFSRASSVQVIQKSRSDAVKPSGADWGIRWQHAVCLMILVCVAAPVVYFLYRFEDDKPRDSKLNVISNT
ncbi:lysM and putative peptidoglycan-binding domain-containing protein 4-like [Symsagittifera roscoffensis]|uniref:lysM and putative peptidoglycan-binding domain-containing protein 4-like n=1 Tax=Symsagittifera roscoffensis TaxID=84072 RepID=UPI00307B8AB2